MKNKYKVFVTLAVSSVLLSGCASIISSSDWPVAIASTPDAASFTVTNKNGTKIHSGTTPQTVTLKSGAGFFESEKYTLHFIKDGFQEKTASLDTNMNGWYFGNLLFGGIIGMLIIDPATGAMYKLPEKMNVGMDKSINSISTDTKVINTIHYE